MNYYADRLVSDTYYESKNGRLIPINIITRDDLHPYRRQIPIMRNGLPPIYKQIFVIREDDLRPIRERLEEAWSRVFKETDGDLDPRDSYGQLVIRTVDAVEKCEQEGERARLLLGFKRTDDRKVAEDAKKKAKRDIEMHKKYKREINKRKWECAQGPANWDPKETGVFEEMNGEWGA